MRLYVVIPIPLQDALIALAQREHRTPRQQAALIIEPALRAALERAQEQRLDAGDLAAVGQAHTGAVQAREAP